MWQTLRELTNDTVTSLHGTNLLEIVREEYDGSEEWYSDKLMRGDLTLRLSNDHNHHSYLTGTDEWARVTTLQFTASNDAEEHSLSNMIRLTGSNVHFNHVFSEEDGVEGDVIQIVVDEVDPHTAGLVPKMKDMQIEWTNEQSNTRILTDYDDMWQTLRELTNDTVTSLKGSNLIEIVREEYEEDSDTWFRDRLMRGDLTLRLSNATTDDKFKHFLVTSNNEPVEWAKLEFHDISDFQTRFKREIDSYEDYYENLSRLYDDPIHGVAIRLHGSEFDEVFETFDTLYDTYPTTALMVGFARCNIDRLRVEFDNKLGTLEGQQEIGNFILDLDHFRTGDESDDIAWGRASNAFQYIWNNFDSTGDFNHEVSTYEVLLSAEPSYIVSPSVTTTNYPVGKTIMSAPMTYRMIVGNILEHQESYSDVTYVPKTDIHESSTHLSGDNQYRFSSIKAITELAKVQHIAQFVESVCLTEYTLSGSIPNYETKRDGFSGDLDLIHGIPTGMYTFDMIEDYSVNQVLRKYVYFDNVDESDNVFNANDFKTTCDAMDLNESTKLINWGTLSNILLDYDTSLTTTNTKQLINKELVKEISDR
jgi:hypothetical protein